MHLALYFPGGSIPGQDPFDNRLAWITMRALEQGGAQVLPVRYDDDVMAADQHRFDDGVRREVRGALAHYAPDRVTLLGKSRGTHALRLLVSEDFGFPPDTRVIWQTPVWRADRSWEAACQSTWPALHLVGLADAQYHDPARHEQVPGETVAIEGADHGLEIAGDILATIESWRTMSEAIIRFTARRS